MKELKIKGNKIILAWNRWHKNLWDELILIWLIKILLKQKKTIFIACSDKEWLEWFHRQFFDTSKLRYIYELPKWFRSLWRLLKNIKDLKSYFTSDAIIVGWGEILTEETPFSYWYWLASSFPFLMFKKFYLMWWIQIPTKIRNKIPFSILKFFSDKIYLRDLDLIERWFLPNKLEFFPDTSFFVYDDLDFQDYRWNLPKTKKSKSIIINSNKKAERFNDKILSKISTYVNNGYKIYFARICKSPNDNDIKYFQEFKKVFPSIELLDYEKDFNSFLEMLKSSEKVFCTRLHLFLISHYLKCDVSAFVYEKKVAKMKNVLNIGK